MLKQELQIDSLISSYEELGSLHKVAKLYHTSHIRVASLLRDNGYVLKNIGNGKVFSDTEIASMISDYIENHLTTEEISKKYSIRIKKLRAIFRENGVKISKWNGHIKKEKIIVDKAAKIINEADIKRCPYCDWFTYDIENKSHAFQKHIVKCHNIDILEHISNYPSDRCYFEPYLSKLSMVQCKECGKILSLIDDRHLSTHNMNKAEYIEKYGTSSLISDSTKAKLQQCIEKMNQNPSWARHSSTYEAIIRDFLIQNKIEFIEHDRNVLNGLELDFLIGNTAIEFHGNKYHTEWFGKKDKNYHNTKTNICNEHNIKLLQIFEDELVYHKEIVLNKIRHILNISSNIPRIMGRKCTIIEISKNTAENFLNEYHIQGFASSTVYLGAIYEDELVGVMTFKQRLKNGSEWELNRFASNYHYICQGIGGKLFKWFVKHYNPQSIISFADRRWTVDKDNNLYTKLGFRLDSILSPDYKYYNPKVSKFTRFHKFNFRKTTLHKKYNLPLTMTETEMVKELGYDRIWDCGLIKYVWKKHA